MDRWRLVTNQPFAINAGASTGRSDVNSRRASRQRLGDVSLFEQTAHRDTESLAPQRQEGRDAEVPLAQDVHQLS